MKKAFIVLIAILISFQSITIASAQDYYDEESTYRKLARMIKGIGYRIGVEWTQDQIQQVVNSALDDKEAGLDYSVSFIGNLPVMEVEKTVNHDLNLSEYLISPQDFINGVKIIQSASGKDTGSFYPLGQLCYPAELDEIASGASHAMIVKRSNGDTWYAFGNFTRAYYSDYYGGVAVDGTNIQVKGQFGINDFGSHWGVGGSGAYPLTVTYSTMRVDKNGYAAADYVQEPLCEYTTTEKPDLSPVSPTKTNLINTYDQPTIIYVDENDYPTAPNPTQNTVLPDEDFSEPAPPPDTDPEPLPEPDDKPSGSSWWDWLLKPLIAAVTAIADAVSGLVKLIGGLAAAIAEAIGAIFVPNAGYFEGYFDEIKTVFDSKMPIIDQTGSFLEDAKGATVGEVVPSMDITLPAAYGGGTHTWLDLSFFSEYRDLIMNFIRFVAWFIFIRRMYAKIPRMIGE